MVELTALIVGLFYVLVVVIPIARILRRTGYSPWLAIMAIVPFLNILVLWLYAFSTWPIDEQAQVRAGAESDRWSEADKEAFNRLQGR